MFKRDHHIRIANVLQSLNSDYLKAQGCYFGGGTAIVLTHGEYRESADIDFVCSNLTGYRTLRHGITGSNSLDSICKDGFTLKTITDIRADQYGIRTLLKVGDAEIKFEIIFEARIALDIPSSKNQIAGVSTLTLVDMAACKLLANSDRWHDDSVFSRDLIDFAMLNLSAPNFKLALAKATQAYGESVKRDLAKAISHLKKNPRRLEACMDALKMESIPKALLWDQVRKILKRIT